MPLIDLRADLARLDLSQSAFARRLGVNPRTVRRWLAGDAPIPLYVASWLALYKVSACR